MNLPETWQNLHHAYFISGRNSDPDEVFLFLAKLGVQKQGNPDLLSWQLETLGIEEARNLSLWALKKAFGERKVAIITLESFTLEAQNALLKLFEEPTPNTYFFLIMRSVGGIAPTLLSRVHVLNTDTEESQENSGEIFLKSDLSKRFKIINPIIKNKDKEKAKELVMSLAGSLKKTKSAKELESILEAEKFLSLRSPSIKMILENLAISL